MERKKLRWPSLGHLLEQSTRENPDKTLFIFGNNQLTYARVNARVNQLANALRKLGVKKGDHVSVMLPNAPEFPVSWLALAKLGAVMIPTNTTYQEHDLGYILTDSEASVLIVHQDYLKVF